MSYYTVVPNIRNQYGTGYINNFCSGHWKVLNDDIWLQLTPKNTRVRDKNNEKWLELCEGHMVQSNIKNDPLLDCACYSKNFNASLNKDLNLFANNQSNAIDFVLYGTLIGVVDFEPYVYIPYYIDLGVNVQLRMYCINKASATIDNILIDTLPSKVKANVYVDINDVVVQTETVKYKVAYDYIIHANFEPSVLSEYACTFYGQILRIKDGKFEYDKQTISVPPGQYCVLKYEGQSCFSVYEDNQLKIYNFSGQLMGSSISDANTVHFFDRYSQLISVEGHDNYIKIRGVESEH